MLRPVLVIIVLLGVLAIPFRGFAQTPAAPGPAPSPSNPATVAESDPDLAVTKAIDAFDHAAAAAHNTEKIAVLAALKRLLQDVIRANTTAMHAANVEESNKLDNLQKKLIDLIQLADAATAGAILPDAADLGLPNELPKTTTIGDALRNCLTTLRHAQAQRAKTEAQAATAVVHGLQNALAAAIQRNDLPEAGRLSDLRKQYEGKIPAAPGAGAAKINLLKTVDLKHNTVCGNWQLVDGTLQSDTTAHARLEFPYQPPEEYDFRVSFSRESGNNCLALLLVLNGRQTAWLMGSDADTTCRFDTASGIPENCPIVHGIHCLVQHGRYECVIQVRKNSVTVVVNGQTIGMDKPVQGQGVLWSKYTLPPGWKLPDGNALGLGSFMSSCKIYAAEVHEISGPGKMLK